MSALTCKVTVTTRVLAATCAVILHFNADAQVSKKPLERSDDMMSWPASTRHTIKTNTESDNPIFVNDRVDMATQRWSLQRDDQTLYRTMSRWVALSGWQLIWDADRDFPIESDVHLDGHLVAVIAATLETLKDSDYPLRAVVNSQNQVIRVVHYLDNIQR